MSDDRADRLSCRRKDRSQSRDDPSSDNTFKTDNTDNTDSVDNSSNTDNTDNASNIGALDENTKTQMMHLPEAQHKRLMHLYTRMKADYEFDDEFEKNRHYFPLVLQYGLDQFEERDAAEIRQDLVEFSNES